MRGLRGGGEFAVFLCFFFFFRLVVNTTHLTGRRSRNPFKICLYAGCLQVLRGILYQHFRDALKIMQCNKCGMETHCFSSLSFTAVTFMGHAIREK